MQQTEQDPEDVTGAAVPRQSDDRPPVGEPLVVSRRNPLARPARAGAPTSAATSSDERGPKATPAVAAVVDQRSVQLDGQVAVVTSAAGELGAAFAAELVGRGARVMLVDVDLAGLLDVADTLSFGRVVPLRCDLGSDADVVAACDFVSRAGPVNLVVHVDESGDGSAGRSAGDGSGGAADGAAGGRGLAGLDDRFRSAVRGPVALFESLAGSFGPSPLVVLVQDSAAGSADALAGAATSVVRDHLPSVDGMRATSAARGQDLGADAFAAAVLDLVLRSDALLEHVALVGAAESAPVRALDADDERSGIASEPFGGPEASTNASSAHSDFDGIDDLGR